MNKLFKLKEWLTIPDAARHLTGVFDEPINEADVLRLGLDGHLTLSVDFVNKAAAKRGRVVPLEQAQTTIFPEDMSANIETFRRTSKLPRSRAGDDDENLPADVIEGLQDGSLIRVITDINIDDEQFLHLEDEVVRIGGVWDLPLIGAERLDVEHAFQQMTGGPEVTLIQLNGTFVGSLTGEIAQLQDRFSEPTPILIEGKFVPRTPATDPDPTRPERQRVRSIGYYPAGGLPADSVLVVRTSALTELQAKMIDAAAASQAPKESTREKNTLLRIIALMANHRYSKEIGAPYTVARHLIGKAAELGVKISDDVIAKHLNAALDLVKSEDSQAGTKGAK